MMNPKELSEKSEKTHVTRSFECEVCKQMHMISLKYNLLENQKKFPFAYLYLHGPESNILTTLYLDANLSIRGSESMDLNKLEGNFLTQKKSNELVQNLAKELAFVRQEYNDLNQKFDELMEKYSELKFDNTLLKTMQGMKSSVVSIADAKPKKKSSKKSSKKSTKNINEEPTNPI
jgi:regulator of replication initiation timing